MLRVVPEDDARQEFALTLDEICRRGAERMLAMALEAEVDAYLEHHLEARALQGLTWPGSSVRPRWVSKQRCDRTCHYYSRPLVSTTSAR